MPTILRETIEDQVYLIVRREILEGRLEEGKRLVQDELASQLGTSRIPVRAALQRLEASRLVVLDAKGAYSVASFSVADFEEIYALRMLLEPHAAALALPSITPAIIERMRRINTEMTAVAEAGDGDRWTELNSAFHMAIYEVCGRPRLLRIIRDLWFGRPTFSPIKTREQLLRSAGDHDAIVTALERCDAARLADLVRNHIKAAGEHWRELLTSRGASRGGD